MLRYPFFPARAVWHGALATLLVALLLPLSAPTVQAATTINVTTTTDELNNDGDCSLREAVQASNLDRAVDACPAGNGRDVINIPAGTYTLNTPDGFGLNFTDSAAVVGAGANSTIIDGNGDRLTVLVTYNELLVCDATNNSVLRFNAQKGTFVDTLVDPGSGGLAFVGAAARGRDGDLYVAGFTSGIHRYNGQTGAFENLFVAPGSGGLAGPTDLVFGPGGVGVSDPDDNLYVTKYQPMGGGVLRYNKSTGAFIDQFVSAGSDTLTPNSIVFGRDDRLYLTDPTSGAVKRYNGKTGAFVDNFVPAFSGGLDLPRGLVFGPDRNLYVASENNDRVLRYNGNTGAFLSTFVAAGSGGLDKPTDIAFGPDGNLYVISKGTKEVLRYDGKTGAFIDTVIPAGRGGMGLPACLLFTPGLGSGPTVNVSGITIRNGQGGGVFVSQDTALTLSESVVAENDSLTGGGISNAGFMQIFNSTIRDNEGGARGGGIANSEGASMEISGSTISGNTVTGGAGILNSGQLRLTNSTLSNNRARRGGGGIQNTGLLYIVSSTITNNQANTDGGSPADAVGGGVKNVGGTVYFWNTIIAGNTDNRGGSDTAAPDCFGTLNSERYNIVGVGSNCTVEDGFADGTPFDQIGTSSAPVNPQLNALADNGGPTQTHSLRSISPAIDAARPGAPDTDIFSCKPTDQRGATRPADGNGDGTARCDIGAFEYGVSAPAPTPDPDPEPEPGPGGGSFRVYLPMSIGSR
jgi:CSLREA domain-containing protein